MYGNFVHATNDASHYTNQVEFIGGNVNERLNAPLVVAGAGRSQVGAVVCAAVRRQQALLVPPRAAQRRRLDGARARPVRLRGDDDGPTAA